MMQQVVVYRTRVGKDGHWLREKVQQAKLFRNPHYMFSPGTVGASKECNGMLDDLVSRKASVNSGTETQP
jgi:hypothetical protein